MLSAEDNELLTHVGAGTPMGELLRRFWLPALVTSEINEPDGAPVRLRLLGEDMLAFRNSDGKVGVIEPLCAHKCTHLFFGRNEENGIRCPYHGWKYDVDGNCVDMPTESERTTFKDSIKLRSYPTQEQGGVVWIYMGPPDKQPQRLPQLEWLRAPEGYQNVNKWMQCANWVQALEGDIDSSHVNYLHRNFDQNQTNNLMASDGAPRLAMQVTPYGFTYGARRQLESGDYYWRFTRWLYPFYSLPPVDFAHSWGRAWVPIDDEHTFGFSYEMRDVPYSEADREYIQNHAFFPAKSTRGTYQFKDGAVIDAWIPVANRENDYLIDRQMQRTVNFSGMPNGYSQDAAAQESMGAISDRTREHLGSTDVAVVGARRLLIKMAKDLMQGIEPEIVDNPDAYFLRGIQVVAPEDDFDTVLEKYSDLGIAPEPPAVAQLAGQRPDAS